MNPIRLITGMSTGAVPMFIVMIISLGMTAGIGVGYNAGSQENATVEWNGTHLTTGNNSSQVLPGQNETFDDIEGKNQFDNSTEIHDFEMDQRAVEAPDGVEHWSNSMLAGQIDTILEVTTLFADSWASFTYRIRDAVPLIYAKLYATGWLLIGGGYSIWHTVEGF